MSLRLGIDTGGTFTDAVLADSANRIVASAKSLTTRHDLTLGIADVLRCLPREQLQNADLVALSTTLSTNSVVEGRGAPVGVLLPGYREQQVEKSGLLEFLAPQQIRLIDGGHDALGAARQPLDETAVRQAVESMQSRVAAFAVSSMFGVRNPAHEIRVREIVEELSARPVTCGHELASDLDAPRRALTVAMNARLVPIIRELVLSVESILKQLSIDAPLMMVKGDGSLINTRTALQRPVGTILSGPAASVVGACALSGRDHAIIADMGGTTTDIAVVAGGRPEISSDGVRIGGWKPMVEAVRVISIGLGGDSEVRFSGQTGIAVGPGRVVPLSLVGHQYPEVRQILERQLRSAPGRRNNRFALRLQSNEVLLAGCNEIEREAWELLGRGPIELDSLVQSDREMARAISTLHRKGLAIYSGFSPTDAAHVIGASDHWCVESARLAALIWARQMRHVFGVGRWQEGDAESPSRQIVDSVSQRISEALIESGLHQHGQLDQSEASGLTGLLAGLLFRSADNEADGDLFQLRFSARYPVVGVGAPAGTFFPKAADQLAVELDLPDHAEVANAFGAVMGTIVQSASVTVTQPRHGEFIVHGDSGPQKHTSLDEAIDEAGKIARRKARELGLAAGAQSVSIRLDQHSNRVRHDLDGELFLDTRITAIATGRPDCGKLSATDPAQQP